VQSAYYQLKPGKVFFKRFSKAIGKDAQGEYFGNCNSLQTLKYLLLYCKHASKGFAQALAYPITHFQYNQGKSCSGRIPKRNKDCYSQVASTSRRYLRAYFNNTIAYQGGIYKTGRNAQC
jgi:hypothetical protein